MFVEAYERLGLDKVHYRHQGGEGHRDCRAPRGADHALAQDIDKQEVEKDVHNCTAYHNPHRFGGVAGCTDKAREVVGERHKEHTRQDDVHILAGVVYRIGRGTEQDKYGLHPQVARCDKQEAEEESQQHCIAEDFLCPAHILAAKDDAHSGRSAGTDQRAKGVDDVHQRERYGQGCEVKLSAAVATVAQKSSDS